MVSEPLLWPFLSSLVFISVTSFLTTLPQSQLPPQPLAVEPPTSSSRRPWVPDLQLPSLRSFTLHRPLPFASPLQILLRLRFWRYHWDRPAPIYTLVEASPPLKTARAPTRHPKLLFRLSHTKRTPTRRSFFSRTVHTPSRTYTRLNSLADVSPSCAVADVTCLRQPLTSSSDSGDLTVDFSSWPLTLTLTLTVDSWLLSELTFCNPGAPYPVFRVDFIFAVHFCIFCF